MDDSLIEDYINPEEIINSGIDWIRISLSGFSQNVYEKGHKNGNIENGVDNQGSTGKYSVMV